MRKQNLIRAFVVAFAGALLLGGAARAQSGAAVTITSPTEGAMVDSPVTIGVEVTGATVKHWNERDPTSVHHHILVDVDPATVIQEGVPLPPGQANIIHTIDLNRQLMDLAPGEHTITVVLTGSDHVPLSPSVQTQVTFTATGRQIPAAVPRTGRGGSLLGDSRASLQIGLILAALLVAGLGGLAIRARR